MGKSKRGKSYIRRRKGERWPAKLPPKGDGQPCEIRYYRTPRQARAAQKQAWASFEGREKRLRASQRISPFSQRSWFLNRIESKFIDWLHERRPRAGVQRGGWPDFLVESDGKLVCVEVKSPQDFLSADQIRCMRLLTTHGLPCYVWQNGTTYTFEEFLQGRPGDAPRCSSDQGSPHKPREEVDDTSEHATLVPDDRKPSEIAPPGEILH